MDDARLARIREGAGQPPLVFVHGYLCDRATWRHQIAHFRPAHTVVACDLRGHGRSPRGDGGDGEMSVERLGADVAALLVEEGLTGAVLVGHSMGCRVVVEAFLRASPGRVAGMVLVDGSRAGRDREAGWAGFDEAMATTGYHAFVRGLFEDMFVGGAPDWKDAALEKACAIPEATGRPLYRNVIAWDADRLEAALSQIDVPVLILQSTYMNPERRRQSLAADETSPYQDLLVARLPKVRSVTVPAGHFSMMELPQEINDKIGQFLVEDLG